MKKIKYFFQNGLLITLIKSWVFKKLFYNFVAGKKKTQNIPIEQRHNNGAY